MSIYIKNLTLSYDGRPVVDHLTATIHKGELLAIVGPNGAGKSTLLNALAGVITEFEGEINGIDRQNIAYMPQQSKLEKSFPINVFDLISSGLWQELGYSRSLNKEAYEKCKNAIEAVGLKGFEEKLIGTLSGGQLQRCLFARVLLQDQQIILLDEPFSAIDNKTLIDLTELIKDWHASDRTVVLVTHDLNYVREYFPKSLLLACSPIDFGDTEIVLTEQNLQIAKEFSESFVNDSF